MNQRKDLQDCYEAGIISKNMLESALKAPVFICNPKHDKLTDQEKEFIGQHVMHDSSSSKGCFPRIVPFPNFRIVFLEDKVYSQWWFSMKERIAVFLMQSSYDDLTAHFRFLISQDDSQVGSNIWINFKPLNKAEDEMAREKYTQNIFNSNIRDLIRFLFDIMSSRSTVVKVTDDQPGRSVQWRLNREHYLVLNRHQAQTMQKNRRGVSDKDLVRGAHWRRAHLRRLMSDKFKTKKGLLVPVKKAWVGPLEWKGHDGKIYKVTELNS